MTGAEILLPGNLVTYNSMLSGLEKAGQWQLALSCLAELQDELELDAFWQALYWCLASFPVQCGISKTGACS